MPLRVILLSLLLSASLLAGDQLEKTVQSPEPATILKSRSELVVVPVVVTDKTGNHISGLKKEDFIVQENGVEQNVAFFDEVTTTTQRLTRTKPHDNTFSNILPEQPTTHRVTIIILDLLNTKFQDQKRMRGDLIKFLSDLDATEPTALYVLTQKGLKVIHDFSTDPKVLIEAVHKLKGSTAQVSDNGANQGESTELGQPPEVHHKSSSTGSIASHPCKVRKDGAPALKTVHTKIIVGWATPPTPSENRATYLNKDGHVPASEL
jgi:VWFA-related protein